MRANQQVINTAVVSLVGGLCSREQEVGAVIDSWLGVVVSGGAEQEGASWVLRLDGAADAEEEEFRRTTAAVQQQQSPMASTTACTEAVPLVYPQEVKNDSARKAYKLKLLKDRPETLFADLYKSGEVSNLIFLTDQPLAWHAAISAHYPSVKKEGQLKIKIKEVEDPDTVMTTVNMNGPNRRNLPPLTTTTPCQRQTPPPLLAAPLLTLRRRSPPPEPAQDPQLDRAITDLKVKFTELERELPTATQDTRVQQDSSAISTELTKLRQDRDSNRRELSTVRTEVRELQQDRESHMARLTALTEEVRELREERRSYRRELTALSEELQERERPEPSNSAATLYPSSISSPHANPTPRSPPITQMNTTPSPQTNHPSSFQTSTAEREARHILIDSNGKFIDENKLFPTHTVAKIWHPTGPPPRQHPWRQDHPHLLPHHAPLRSHQGSYDYPQARPEPLLSPGVPPQPQRRELHPDPLSYAQATLQPRKASGPAKTQALQPRKASGPAKTQALQPRKASGPAKTQALQPRKASGPAKTQTLQPRKASGPAKTTQALQPRKASGPAKIQALQPRKASVKGINHYQDSCVLTDTPSREQEVGAVIDSWLGVVVSEGAEQEGASWVLRLDGAADAEVVSGGAEQEGASWVLRLDEQLMLKVEPLNTWNPCCWAPETPYMEGHRDVWLKQQVCRQVGWSDMRSET
ncbi:hypothetical protein F7725_010861, partial [Dissostichus mawsoni]